MANRPTDPLSGRPRRQGILADDLTGAGDTGLQFFGGSLAGDTWIVPELLDSTRAPADAAVIAVNVESRHLLPAEAAVRMDRGARFLARAGCTHFYQKIDSTLRGNLPTEILQTLRTLDLELAIVAPAFPQTGRITVGGYQLVDGVPVNASVYGSDPITPVKHSHLPTLLAEHAEPGSIAFLELRDVMTGAEAVVGAIVRAIANRCRFLVIDAARNEDLLAIARGMALTPFRLLPVGSAGLARAMQPLSLLDAPRTVSGPHRLLGNGPPVLIAAGSLNPVTRGQIQALRQEIRVLEIDVRSLLLGHTDALERTFGVARQLLLGRQDVVLTTVGSDETLRHDRALARDLAMGSWQVGAQLSAAIGQLTARLCGEVTLSGLVLAGGDTALSACRALGGGSAGTLRLMGELMPTIPLCRLEQPAGPMRVVTKSGGFGPPDVLRELVRRLKLGASV
jgi:uncharacterized protein YgbK (DUF1537 family)